MSHISGLNKQLEEEFSNGLFFLQQYFQADSLICIFYSNLLEGRKQANFPVTNWMGKTSFHRHFKNIAELLLEISICNVDIPFKDITVQSIRRKPQSDTEISLIDKVLKYPQTKSLKIDEDFVKVKIHTSRGAEDVEFHAEVATKLEVLQRKLHKGGLDANVLMIGFDSTSSAQMQRALPEVYKYLKNELSSHIFQGYSIVGDGTTPQLAAMLTGKGLR